MAWIEGPHVKPKKRSTNDELEEVKGTLTDSEAQLWFAKYCLANPKFIVFLLTGVKLAPIQDMLLRAFILKDYSLLVAGRGFSKSFIISLFCIIYCIAHPGVKLGLCSGTFRQSKSIMKQIEVFASHPQNGRFLRSCITKELTKGSDQWSMEIGGSSIIAIPLGKIRGYRFNVLVVDELLQVSKETLDSILKPFLAVKQDGPLAEEIERAQELLVKRGVMKPEEVETFYPSNKIIGLSSASFKFESLYKDNYLPYIDTILDPDAKQVNHAVFRFSYRLAPKGYMSEAAIADMKRTMSQSMFDRELEAIFSDDSGGFFSAMAMELATIPKGGHPTVKVKGEANKKYVLSIDPNYSNAETSDDFAISVFELDDDEESGILVHSYALANSTNEKRAMYFRYLLESFNIVYIIVDNSGGPSFIEMCDEFKMLPYPLALFEHDFLNFNWEEGLTLTKENFKPSEGKIVHSQPFGRDNWLRIANENLLFMIEKKKIKFAAAVFNDSDLSRMIGQSFPIEHLHYSKTQDVPKRGDQEKKELAKTALDGMKIDFIEHLGEMIVVTKKQTSLIEASETSGGNQSYNLPKTMTKDSNNPLRPRRDQYTALLLGAWGVKCYYDLHKKIEKPKFLFLPRMFG